MKRFETAMLAFGLMLAALPVARAADTICPPNPSPGVTVNGNLLVPSGQSCSLLGDVTVTGNVQVQMNANLQLASSSVRPGPMIGGNVNVGTGATLIVLGFFQVDGNIDAEQCNVLHLGTDTLPATGNIGGNVVAQDCTSPGGNEFVSPSKLLTTEISGNLTCNNNVLCFAEFINVKGNAQFNNNVSAHVKLNTIGGNLICQDNENIFGEDNTVAGSKLGQCAGL